METGRAAPPSARNGFQGSFSSRTLRLSRIYTFVCIYNEVTSAAKVCLDVYTRLLFVARREEESFSMESPPICPSLCFVLRRARRVRGRLLISSAFKFCLSQHNSLRVADIIRKL